MTLRDFIHGVKEALQLLNSASKAHEDYKSTVQAIKSPGPFRAWLEAEAERLGPEHFAGVCRRPGFSPLAFFLINRFATTPTGDSENPDTWLSIGFGRIVFFKVMDDDTGKELATFDIPPWADRYVRWVNAQGEMNGEVTICQALRGLTIVETMNKAEAKQLTKEIAQRFDELTSDETLEKLGLLAEAEEMHLREALDRA